MINGCFESYKIHYSGETGIRIYDIINDGAAAVELVADEDI
jgi:hypothetical protein